jgi:hypothetical protein
MKTFTEAEVAKMLADRREPDVPMDVLRVLKENDGKPLTKRLLVKLPGGEASWYINHIASMTQLRTTDLYERSRGVNGYSFLLAYQTKNVVIDAAWVVEHNPAYFGAREDRNSARDRIKASDIRELTETLNGVARARKELATAEGRLEALTRYGAKFYADDTFWRGLVEDPRKSRR